MKKRREKKITLIKLTKAHIEAIERQYFERYNAEITQWQANQY